VACVLAGLVGCATVRQPPPEAGPEPTAAELSARLAAQGESLATFRGQARLRLASGDDKFKSSQMITVRDPGGLRIDVMNPFGVSYSLATDGRRLSAFDHGEGVFYAGPSTAGSMAELVGVGVDPGQLTALLRGLVPRLDIDGDGEVRYDDGRWLWRRPLVDGGVLELGFAGPERRLVSLRLLDSPELGSVEAAFAEFKDVDGVAVAHQIDVRWRGSTELDLHYAKVWRDLLLSDAAFRIEPKAGARTVEVGQRPAGDTRQ
jgi:hypothetical protein